MAEIQVVNENGELVYRDVISKEVIIFGDGDFQFEPSIVQNTEYDDKMKSSSVTTQCGETENRQEGEEKPSLTFECILTEEEKETAKLLKQQAELDVIADIDQDTYFCKRVTVSQSPDLKRMRIGGQEHIAFSCQIQLRKP
jgi:hypothetical protein